MFPDVVVLVHTAKTVDPKDEIEAVAMSLSAIEPPRRVGEIVHEFPFVPSTISACHEAVEVVPVF